MDNERIRAICMALPHVAETLNWGHHLVYWVGERELGGRMFAMTDIDASGVGVLSFHCGPERFHELLETEGIRPTPYLTRTWVTLERWSALRPMEIEEELRRAHALTLAKLTRRTRTLLALPDKERARLVRERRVLRNEEAAATQKKTAPSKATAPKKTTATKKQTSRKASSK